MNPPAPQLPPDGADRLADILELLTKAAGLFALAGAFIQWAIKPYIKWRRARLTEAITAALEPAMQTALEPLKGPVMLSLERQNLIFDELDLFITIVAEHQDRQDETNTLLDEVGLASHDRRVSETRRRRAVEALEELQGRARMRRRRGDDLPVMEGPPQ